MCRYTTKCQTVNVLIDASVTLKRHHVAVVWSTKCPSGQHFFTTSFVFLGLHSNSTQLNQWFQRCLGIIHDRNLRKTISPWIIQVFCVHFYKWRERVVVFHVWLVYFFAGSVSNEYRADDSMSHHRHCRSHGKDAFHTKFWINVFVFLSDNHLTDYWTPHRLLIIIFQIPKCVAFKMFHS